MRTSRMCTKQRIAPGGETIYMYTPRRWQFNAGISFRRQSGHQYLETKICLSSWIQKSRRIYVRLRTGPQFAHLWWPAVAKLQAYSLGSCATGQTNGRIALFRNAPPLGRGHNKTTSEQECMQSIKWQQRCGLLLSVLQSSCTYCSHSVRSRVYETVEPVRLSVCPIIRPQLLLRAA